MLEAMKQQGLVVPNKEVRKSGLFSRSVDLKIQLCPSSEIFFKLLLFSFSSIFSILLLLLRGLGSIRRPKLTWTQLGFIVYLSV